MQHRILACVSLFWLSACAASDNSAIVSACVEQGGEQEKCSCMADLAEEKLPAETYKSLADISRNGDEASENFLKSMSLDEAGQLALVAGEAAQTCRIGGLDWLFP